MEFLFKQIKKFVPATFPCNVIIHCKTLYKPCGGDSSWSKKDTHDDPSLAENIHEYPLPVRSLFAEALELVIPLNGKKK